MSNDNRFERLWKLQAKVNMMVLDGRRDPKTIANIYQAILEGSVTASFAVDTKSWREEDGVIYFSVTSDGTTGEDWIKRLECNGFRVGDCAKQVLRSPDFKPTNGVTTEVVVLKGMLFEDNDRITKKIRAEADKRKLLKPNPELACLIREKLTDKEIAVMGLTWIVTVHEPIKDAGGDPSLLSVICRGDGPWLRAFRGGPGDGWGCGSGFAFAVSQAGPVT